MKRLLIANRGEVALRIQRACQELGIETVAAYTRADASLLHLGRADRTVCIGETSYLDSANFVSAAQITGCDAIHPGYGFLSEDAGFAEMVEAAGLVFVGPTSTHIDLMGDKANARRVLHASGIPVLPGSDGAVPDLKAALTAAEQIGYPVMLKASQGGGGRGIQIADDAAALEQGFATVVAQSEALFGSSDVYIEKYLIEARHIEIQVFGDGRGKVVHFGARECSIQRRHQKLIEEAPPPDLDNAIIHALAKRCCDSLAAMSYRNAGTLEFLFQDGDFYFIEMNTRIQVEHPVTECVTGNDLVKLQLSLCMTGELSLDQSDISWRGHAIECRINAEDERFVPSPGPVDTLVLPGGPGTRCDTHLYQGYHVPHQYDSLLAKLIVYGRDRSEAVARMQRALLETEIGPLANNVSLHRRILAEDDFRAGSVTTDYIQQKMDN